MLHGCFDGGKGDSVKSFAPINEEGMKRRVLSFKHCKETPDNVYRLGSGAILSEAELSVQDPGVQVVLQFVLQHRGEYFV